MRDLVSLAPLEGVEKRQAMGVGGRGGTSKGEEKGDKERVETEKQAEPETRVDKNSSKGRGMTFCFISRTFLRTIGTKTASFPFLKLELRQVPRHFLPDDGFLSSQHMLLISCLVLYFYGT